VKATLAAVWRRRHTLQ